MKTVEQVKEEMITDIERDNKYLKERLEENNTKLGILNRSKL